MEEASLDRLEDRIGYHFNNRYLLECALTHSSFTNEQKIRSYESYERLEFLGDAVLELVSSDFLYRHYPDRREGEMTKLRSSLVCEPALAYCARDLHLEEYIRLGRGEERNGGRQNDSIISDVLEATIGAMYLDSGGIEAPQRYILEHVLSDLEGKLLFSDSKSALQELAQKQGQDVVYRLLEESGPNHRMHFRVAACLGGQELAQGEGRSKKEAEQRAAYEALRRLRSTEHACT